jgi:hypothetical protein
MSSITELVPSAVALSLSPEEADVLLEIAYLVAAVDGRLADEELSSFAALASRLRGESADIDALIARFAPSVDLAEIEARVRELAPGVPERARELAYTIALSVALADHDPSELEDRLHGILGEVLHVPAERRAALSGEVAFGGGKAGAKAP